MTIHTYLFEAKSIQSYIFSTNKLKEIVGGSELIEQLTSKKGLVSTTLETLGLKNDINLSRCGGAAFYAFSEKEESIQILSSIWPLLFRQYAPDLEFIHAVGSGTGYREAMEVAHETLMADRNQPKPRLPQANVYTRRFARTGEPVSLVNRHGEALDQVTKRKLAFKKPEGLVKRMFKESSSEDWPINLTPAENGENERLNFPFEGQTRLIGLVHADGNGLGQLLMNLKKAAQLEKLADKDYVEVFKGISEAIQTATEDAAGLAVEQVLQAEQARNSEQLFPARPIVLGGDDLTMIVRADLALPFTEAYLNAFEETSRQALTVVKQAPACKQLNDVIPDYLTACAGIVYAKSSQPFSLLHELAEGLCKQAKKISKANLVKEKESSETAEVVPSSISFYRVTSSLTDSYGNILKNELTFGDTQLSRTCFTTKEHSDLPELSDLMDLQALLESAEGLRGALRQIVGLLHQSRAQAIRRYQRLSEVMEERSKENQWGHFITLMAKLSQDRPVQSETGAVKQGDFVVNFDKAQDLPVEDVLSLIAVDNKLLNTKAAEGEA